MEVRGRTFHQAEVPSVEDLEEASAVVVLVDLEVEALAAVEPEDHGKKKEPNASPALF
jgi:hypothetical protein